MTSTFSVSVKEIFEMVGQGGEQVEVEREEVEW